VYRDHVLVNAPAHLVKKLLSDPFIIAGISGPILLELGSHAVFVFQGFCRGDLGLTSYTILEIAL